MALPKPGQTRDTSQEPSQPVQAPARKKVAVKAPAFVRATSTVKTRLIVNIQGPEKTGKDHMGFSFTGGPIYVHSMDQGLEGVVQKFQNTREIYTAEYELTIQPGEASEIEVGRAADIVWEQFKANYRDSLASTRTEGLVIIDTGTEAWELLRLASFGKLTQVLPHHYSKPNAEFRDLVREGYDASNVVWIHKMKPEYENFTDSQGKEKSRKTGGLSVKMMNDIPFLVQANVQTWSQPREGGGTEFGATIIDCRLNPDLTGLSIPNDLDQLIMLATQV